MWSIGIHKIFKIHLRHHIFYTRHHNIYLSKKPRHTRPSTDGLDIRMKRISNTTEKSLNIKNKNRRLTKTLNK
jgi:hypothetical protein